MSKLDEIIKKINKTYGEKIITIGEFHQHVETIPFSSSALNYMTYGGLPRGRLIEFFGEEGGGKSSTALDIVKNAQIIFEQEYDAQIAKYEGNDKLSKTERSDYDALIEDGPKNILYIDVENTIDLDWATKLGVDVSKIIFVRPQGQDAEEIFQDTYDLVQSGCIGLVVLDSIGSLVSKQSYDKTIEQRTYGGISMALTAFSQKMVPLCAATNCTFIGINQLRDDMGNPYGGSKTPGGRSWKFLCSVRLQFKKGSFIDDVGNEIRRSSEAPQGNMVMVDIAKTKAFKPDRKIGQYTLTYSNGINVLQDLVEMAFRFNIILKGGAWYTFIDPETGEFLLDADGEVRKVQGRANVIAALEEDPELRVKIQAALQPHILGID